MGFMPPAMLQGRPSVHDGDTIRIGKASIRLWGIDAPELRQTCGNVACGYLAREALKDLIGDNTVICSPRGKSHKRVVATCRVKGRDIAQEMMRMGMAFDAPKYSNGYYKVEEAAARSTSRGVWAMDAKHPAQWRACHLKRKQAAC